MLWSASVCKCVILLHYEILRIATIVLVVSERIVFVTSGAYAKEAITGMIVNARLSTAAFALSVGTNGFATGAIAYKAWCVIVFVNCKSC
jgi:hypothetical protein